VLRSAVGVAKAAVLWPEHATAPLSLATFRASAGAVEHAKLCRVRSLRAALLEAQDQGFSVVGLDAGAESSLRKLDLRGPLVLVLGSEHEGLSRSVRQQCTALARLPMADGVASLNASVAAALALYEAACQRGLT
jgi:23S rRNA (guanosine2251-2'-O)-methyltransferase